MLSDLKEIKNESKGERKMRIKKLGSFLMAGIMTFSLTACTGTTEKTESMEEGKVSETNSDDITLNFWHVWPSGDMADCINTFIEQYTEEHPNIKIEQVTATAGDYKTRKLPVAVAGGEQGDIFFSYGAGYSQPFVDADAVLALDDYMKEDKTEERLLPGMTDNFIYDGKTYGVPLKNWAVVLYCNSELFESNNIKYPETFDQLLDAIHQFNELGITPMALGAKNAVGIELIQNALAVKTAGAEAVADAQKGTGSFDTPEIAESAQLVVELMENKAFPDGVLGLDAQEAVMDFHTGHAAMLVTGSWEALQCESENSDLNGLVKAMPFPVVEGGKGEKQTSGGSIDCFMVSKKTEHPDEAFDFAVKLAEYLSEEAYRIGDSLPAWKVDVNPEEVNPVLLQVKEFAEDYDGYALAWDTALTGEAIEKHMSMLQELLGGLITPEEFAKQMQEVNQKVLAGE